MSRIKDLRASQEKLVSEARAFLDEVTPGMPEADAKAKEAAYDKAMAEHDRLEELIQREIRLDVAQKVLDASDERRDAVLEDRGQPGKKQEDGQMDSSEVFKRMVRYGKESLSKEERSFMNSLRDKEDRAQSTSTTAGGYTIPEGFLPEITRSMAAWGPMLDPGVTRILDTATGNDLPWPTVNDTSNEGALLSENTQADEQDITFGTKQLNAFKFTSKIVRVSEELLQDSAFNMQSEVIDPIFGERLGRAGNRYLTVGTGSGQPNGIVTASSAGWTAATPATLTFDDLIELEHSVDPAYRMAPTCRFMFHDSTLKVLRKIKDGQGNYLWQPADARTGAPALINSKPYTVNQNMAEIAPVAKPVVFGDFNKYIVRRVREYVLKRLVERYADYDQVGFLGFMRIDGELSDTAAVKHLVMQSG
jgi:HK97 family phage major capsid protein